MTEFRICDHTKRTAFRIKLCVLHVVRENFDLMKYALFFLHFCCQRYGQHNQNQCNNQHDGSHNHNNIVSKCISHQSIYRRCQGIGNQSDSQHSAENFRIFSGAHGAADQKRSSYGH